MIRGRNAEGEVNVANYLPVVVVALVVLAIIGAVWLHFRR
jgi:hypothetical protein